mgnify:FL=1
MASTLKINTLTGVTTAGSIAVTGEGNSTTTNLQQGLVKCWVNFDGTATDAAARDSFNVSGMTDNGTGDYTVTINNDMANDDYYFGSLPRGNSVVQGVLGSSSLQTGSINNLRSFSSADSAIDRDILGVCIMGDLA